MIQQMIIVAGGIVIALVAIGLVVAMILNAAKIADGLGMLIGELLRILIINVRTILFIATVLGGVMIGARVLPVPFDAILFWSVIGGLAVFTFRWYVADLRRERGEAAALTEAERRSSLS